MKLATRAAPSALDKGVPALGGKGLEGLSLLAGDLPLPAAVLRESALTRNRRRMSAFIQSADVSLCPHGKTTMSPELFAMQIEDGVWGITLCNSDQVKVARACGVNRVLLANQLVGRANAAYIISELNASPSFDFFCLVDSVAGAQLLAEYAREFAATRPIDVLVEVGFPGGRTGVRDAEAARELVRFVSRLPELRLSGVECYEGLAPGDSDEAREASVRELLDRVVALARFCDRGMLFEASDVILSAGGSEYYDICAASLRSADLSRPPRVVIRSGCYISHDSVKYFQAQDRLNQRIGRLAAEIGDPEPALEVWGGVLSVPEPGLAIVSAGKRDVSSDWDLPLPLHRYSTRERRLEKARPGWKVSKLNDQHAYLHLPVDVKIEVGDLIGFGISHPCTTFDKWRVIPIVDDDYVVIDHIRTFF